MFLRLDFLLKIEDLKGVAPGRNKTWKKQTFYCKRSCSNRFAIVKYQNSGVVRFAGYPIPSPAFWDQEVARLFKEELQHSSLAQARWIFTGQGSRGWRFKENWVSWINDWTTFLRHFQDSPSPVFRNRRHVGFSQIKMIKRARQVIFIRPLKGDLLYPQRPQLIWPTQSEWHLGWNAHMFQPPPFVYLFPQVTSLHLRMLLEIIWLSHLQLREKEKGEQLNMIVVSKKKKCT